MFLSRGYDFFLWLVVVADPLNTVRTDIAKARFLRTGSLICFYFQCSGYSAEDFNYLPRPQPQLCESAESPAS